MCVKVAGDQVASSLRVGRGALVQAVDPASNAGKAGLQGTRRTLSGIAAGKFFVSSILSTLQRPTFTFSSSLLSLPFRQALYYIMLSDAQSLI